MCVHIIKKDPLNAELFPLGCSLSLQYNEELHYVEPCLNGTLVQADRTNKEVRRLRVGVALAVVPIIILSQVLEIHQMYCSLTEGLRTPVCGTCRKRPHEIMAIR